MSMRDRIARAIYERHLPPPSAALGDALPQMEVPRWEAASSAVQNWVLEQADAVLNVIEEPTTAMVEAADDEHERCDGRSDLDQVWRTMVKAARQ